LKQPSQRRKKRKDTKKKPKNEKIYEKHFATRVSPTDFSNMHERFDDAKKEAMRNMGFKGFFSF